MMRMVQSDVLSTPLRAWTGGSAGARAVVFLHGFEQHPGAAPWLDKLAERRPVYAPEAPGFGGSAHPADLVDMQDLVLHYRALLTPLVAEHGKVDLVGHSLGGMFAAEIAIACPDLVERLVLVNAYGLWSDDLPQPDVFVMPQPEFNGAKWADPAQAALETNSFDGPEQNYVYYRSANLGAASRYMWPLADRGLVRRLKYLRQPVLVLHGTADGLVPEGYADLWAEKISGARVEKIPGAGHLPMVEAEGAFLAALQRFLD